MQLSCGASTGPLSDDVKTVDPRRRSKRPFLSGAENCQSLAARLGANFR